MVKQIKKITKASTLLLADDTQTFQDFKNSLLIVSLFINAFLLTGWIILQITSRYDAAVVSILFG